MERRRKDVTGSVASVKSDDFNKGIINSPEQLLQGKVSGVNITSASGEPGSAQRITIRGVGSMRAGVTPLFVVDGMILDNSGTGGAINPLSFLTLQDIGDDGCLEGRVGHCYLWHKRCQRSYSYYDQKR